MIDLGHTRIGFVGGLPPTYTAKRRLARLRATMRSAGLEVNRSWVTARGYRPDQGRSALDLLMSQSPPPTALVIANINAALGALKEARQLGLDVPANLSIVSIHGAWTAENTWPPLTAVKMPMRELGRAAVAALYNRLHDLPLSGHVVTDRAPLLMLRESTRVLR